MLKGALCAYYKGPVVLEVVVAPVTGTPTHMRREAEEAAQRQAREALAADPGVAALKRTFNARVNENSVRPRSGTSEERGT
ncbi:DNA polymerase III subunit gamma/tau C-terminal domain-containing protein [Acidiferrobacter sp.]|nr:DNA polymerase III subunit gamma/tau C-terminal domain-containing protein [Acidiferrobacter sp.]